MVTLRVTLGLVWCFNLIFIFDPENAFFSTFAATAGAFGPSSLGGPGLPAFVAASPVLFSVVIAAVSVYLAIAFLFGLTTRLACCLGAVFAVLLLVSQFGTTFGIPGGTDVGPMPLYLASYLALTVGRADYYLSLDARLARSVDGRTRWWWTRAPALA
jgi:hypothetical protein